MGGGESNGSRKEFHTRNNGLPSYYMLVMSFLVYDKCGYTILHVRSYPT